MDSIWVDLRFGMPDRGAQAFYVYPNANNSEFTLVLNTPPKLPAPMFTMHPASG